MWSGHETRPDGRELYVKLERNFAVPHASGCGGLMAILLGAWLCSIKSLVRPITFPFGVWSDGYTFRGVAVLSITSLVVT